MAKTLLFLLCLLNFSTHAYSQTSQAQIDIETDKIELGSLSPQEFDALLSRLSDEQVRTILIDQFALHQETQSAASSGILQSARQTASILSERFSEVWASWPQLPQLINIALEKIQEAGGISVLLLAFAVSFIAGFTARYFWRRKASVRQTELARRNAHLGPYATLGVIGDTLLYLVIDLSSAVVFAVVAFASVYVFFGNADLRLIVSTYIVVATILLITRSIVELLFPRQWPIYRILPLDDHTTGFLHHIMTFLAFVWAFGDNTSQLFLGFEAPVHAIMLFYFLCTVIFMTTALLSLRYLHYKTSPLLPPEEQKGLAATLERNWSLILSAILIAIATLFFTSTLLEGESSSASASGLKSISVFFGFIIVALIFKHYFKARDFSDSVKDAIYGALRAILAALFVVIFLSIWGFDATGSPESGIADRLLKALIDVGITALIGWSLWVLCRTLIDARLAQEEPDKDENEPSEGEGGLGASRTATLLPLLRSSAFALIGITCLFAAASSLGVNVAPLIAGAGVVGLAIGFGAQTLVRDIVSGVFFLIDDAFRRGEYVDLGTVKGTVERISVRSLQLRHHLGAVHTIPFGEITALTNYSRDWVIMKLPLRLTFDTDPQAVKKIIKKIAAEMSVDDILGPKLLEPPKSQGVIQMEDSAMILRVKFKAIPGDQFVVRRELLHRIRAAFETAGIRFASREVTVRVSDEIESEKRQEAAGAAARRLVEAEGGPQGEAPAT